MSSEKDNIFILPEIPLYAIDLLIGSPNFRISKIYGTKVETNSTITKAKIIFLNTLFKFFNFPKQ